MAIFWNHIKGTGNASDNNSGLWTWIEWSKENITKIPETLTDELSPEIKVKIGNGSPEKSLGNIITTNANITTHGDWTITGNWIHKYVQSIWQDEQDTEVFIIDPTNKKCQILGCSGIHFNLTDQDSPKSFSWQFNGDSKMELSESLVDEKKVYSYSVNVDTEITKTLTVSDKCEASYFNATSDKRAKENITPATFSGLNLINKLPVYTFNYKDKTDVVPGILAQDLLEAQPEELNLVDNIAATGENGDYMSIKADKLIFVLMQAIKEQQAQIDELKAELKKLTK